MPNLTATASVRANVTPELKDQAFAILHKKNITVTALVTAVLEAVIQKYPNAIDDSIVSGIVVKTVDDYLSLFKTKSTEVDNSVEFENEG